MIFKGIPFRRNRKIVDLPNFDYLTGARYPHSVPGRENYVVFGKIVTDKNRSDSAVKTNYKNAVTQEWLYAEPIEAEGHSLVNMMYGSDGRVYLMKNGIFYSAVLRKD